MKTFVLVVLVSLPLSTLARVTRIPEEAFTFDFNITAINVTPLREEKLAEAIALLQRVFATAEFKERILDFRFNGERQFWMNRGLSNEEIYRTILRGFELVHPYDNNAMDVEVEFYRDMDSTVVGYTKPRARKIWMNLKYFRRRTSAEIAGHLLHEWLHKLGFGHERERSESREYSVPYGVGYIATEIAEELVSQDAREGSVLDKQDR